MGYWKSVLADNEARRSIAMSIMLSTGVFRSCEYHGDVFLADEFVDPQPAYMRAAWRFKHGEFHDLFESQKELTDEIQELVTEFSWDECPICWKINRD